MIVIAALVVGFLVGTTAIMVFASLVINDTSFYRKEAAFYKKHAQDWEQQAKDWKQLLELVQSTEPNPDDPEKSE